MTRGTVTKRNRRKIRVVAFVLYDDDSITEIVCPSCIRAEDPSDVTITDPGSVRCDRCGEVCE